VRLVNEETGEEVSQLAELARKFPDQFVEQKDGQDYVAHSVINQRLLSVVGPFDFQLVEVLRSDVPEVKPDPTARSRRAQRGTPELRGVVTGGVWRLTCDVDGRRTQVEEVGDTDPHNWPTDGARLKDAASDALKRAAMRLGLGLSLWAQELYFLDRQLQPLTSRPVNKEQAVQEQGRVDTDRARQSVQTALRDPSSPAWQKDGAR
jgi:hypothetical protein